MTLLILISFTFVSNISSAATWYGFCYGKKSDHTFCSNIQLKTLDFTYKCEVWAKNYGATLWGNKTATTTEQLSNQQAKICQEIIGDNPDTNKNFECYVVSYCQNNGLPTSSISPISLNVLASDKIDAIKKCGDIGKNIYSENLKASSLSNCYSQIQVRER